MVTVRSAVILGAVLAGTAVFSALSPAHIRRVESARAVRNALSLPGTGLCVMTDAQAAGLAHMLDGLLRRDSRGRLALRDFLETVRIMKQTGACRAVRVYPGARTLEEVCREMGGLVLQQQKLTREGRKAQVAAFLKGLRTARENGVPEAKVQQMVRTATAEGMLSLCPAGECRRVEERLRELASGLVRGEMMIAGQTRDGALTKEALLWTAPGLPGPFEKPIEVSGL